MRVIGVSSTGTALQTSSVASISVKSFTPTGFRLTGVYSTVHQYEISQITDSSFVIELPQLPGTVVGEPCTSAPHGGWYLYKALFAEFTEINSNLRRYVVLSLGDTTAQKKYDPYLHHLFIAAPHGLTPLRSGSTVPILIQNSTGAPAQLRESTDGGTTWQVINSAVPDTQNIVLHALPAVNSGQYVLSLVVESKPEWNYRVFNSGAFNLSETNPAMFSFTNPSAGSVLVGSNNQTVSWSGRSDKTIELLFSPDGGGSWQILSSSIPAGAGSYNWSVPQNINTDKGMLLLREQQSKTTRALLGYVGVYDSLALLTPTAGSILEAGTKHSIKWNTVLGGTLKLEFSSDGGETWSLIQSGLLSNAREFLWEVPAITSYKCLVRVSSTSNGYYTKQSDTAFSVWKPLQAEFTGVSDSTADMLSTGIVLYGKSAGVHSLASTFYHNRAPYPSTLPIGVVNIGKYYWKVTATGGTFTPRAISAPLRAIGGIWGNAGYHFWPACLRWLWRADSLKPWVNLGSTVTENGNAFWLRSERMSGVAGEFTVGSEIPEHTLEPLTIKQAMEPLPVELVAFSAMMFKNAVLLTWRTATEVDNYGFEIERKRYTGAGYVWESIGFVSGAGNSNSTKDYDFLDEKPLPNVKSVYRLKQVDVSGSYAYSPEIEVRFGVPVSFGLEQNFPNPFNPSTNIRFTLERSEHVTLEVFTVLGEHIETLANSVYDAGTHTIVWNAKEKATGVYVYRLTAGEHVGVRKMILFK